MITANEANKQTKEVIFQLKEKAIRWAEAEWGNVNSEIENAISLGKFEASYWWFNEVFKTSDIRKEYAIEALAEKATSLGFMCQVCKDYSNSILRIEIKWGEI